MPKELVTIRAATPEDMHGVSEIHEYYTLNTVITFKTEVTPTEDHVSNLEKVQGQHLPYIVAVCQDSKVVGYSYTAGFRHAKGGYRHTVELSLFVHPDFLYQGIGSSLLQKLLDVLSKPEENTEYVAGMRSEDSKVRQIIACMAVNTESKEEGLGLKNFYENFGFTLNGHLKQVGHKFDKW